MPKTKLQNREKQFDKLAELIGGKVFMNDLTIDDLASLMGVSRNTAARYRKDFGQLSLSTVLNLCKALSIPIEDVRATIRY